MHDTDWDDLRYFVAIDRSGSIAAAAKYLGTSHSTVLRRVASLEKKLGARLFDRLPKGYSMTSAGERLRSRLDGVADQIEGAQREISGLDASQSGLIRVTSTDTLAHGLVMPHLAAFRKAQPGIRLELVVSNAFLSLTKREADVALRPSNRPPENLVGRKIGQLRTALYGARGRIRGNGEWQNHDWVAPDESLAHLAQSKWIARHVPRERVVATVDSLLGMVEAVRAGLGIGLLLVLLAERHRDLVRLAEPDDALDTEIWLLTHSDLRRVPRIRLFMDFMYERLHGSPGVVS
jgi:DNA-binding transcriptional LysR family regulator